MVDISPQNRGSHRVDGRSHQPIPAGCEKFLARKQACELANLASPRRFLEKLAQWQQKADEDPTNACAKPFVDMFHQVARKRNITIRVA